MNILKEIRWCIENYFTHGEAIKHLMRAQGRKNQIYRREERAEAMLRVYKIQFPHKLSYHNPAPEILKDRKEVIQELSLDVI